MRDIDRLKVGDRIFVTSVGTTATVYEYRITKRQIVKPDGSVIDFEAKHTFSDEQVEWFRAGSALNVVRRKVAEGAQ